MTEALPVGTAPIFHDPYPEYHAMRAEAPLRYEPGWNGWSATGYREVAALLREPRLKADRSELFFDHLDDARRAALEPLARAHAGMMLFADPPRHTRLRGLVNRAFTPRVVDALRGRVQAVIDGLLDAVVPAGRMDVVADLAYPLPTVVIAELLGVPAADRDLLKAWSDDFAAFIGGQAGAPEIAERANASVVAWTSYFHAVVEERRRAPGPDLISALLAASERGDVLDEDELVATALLVLVAGHETTTNLIGNGLLALLHQPNQLALVRDDPALLRGAVEELLRYDSPVQVTSRMAGEDFAWEGHGFRAGQFVDLWLGAANRDPAQFPNPDRLDVRREEVRHLAFGYGAHFCVGAPLARLEGQMALGTLLRRCPDVALDAASDALTHHETTVFRALRSLPVVFTPPTG
ncbi:MAG: Putative cytochrome P450 hydroxylase [uncultured Thermomicrobiales bacterium]|uniref:Cytochrome P450 hydroxylase n=1 Tax=uncultured Thermomicrobiales bacterium TaxID=1645740 RepID=A0A6J4TY97_9BACT|nr:MAG: Putative cytochrome P450 hydroxylase [uncultured Thermomicrobiales bacterium]